MKEKVTFQELMGAFHIGDTICNDAVYQALLEQMKENANIVPVIGAGLSCWAGYPLWGGLLKEKAKGTPKEKKIDELLRAEEYEQAAEELEGVYKRNPFQRILREEFSSKKLEGKERPPYQRLLPELFKGPFVTTNFDVSLERLLNGAYPVTPENEHLAGELNHRIQARERVVVKLHGSVEDPEHMILTKRRYNEVYGENPAEPDVSKALPNAIRQIFSASFPLFLGCGLGPDRTCAVFRACKGATGFALLELPEETVNASDPLHPHLLEGDEYLPKLDGRLEQLDELNLQVIWYPHGMHDAVRVLIEQLAADMGVGGSPAEPPDERVRTQPAQYAQTGKFIGREEQVRQVLDWFTKPSEPILLLQGVAGIGKTAICREAYNRKRKETPEFDMPFVDLIGAAGIPDFQKRLADGLGIKLSDLAPEGVQEHLLREIAAQRMCFAYLDNFEDLWNRLNGKERGALTRALRQLAAVGLRLLISSQVALPREKTIPVPTLDGDMDPSGLPWEEFCALERTKLFLEALGRELTRSEREAFATLVRETEGHPLAIVLTARAGTNCLLNDLLTRWHRLDLGEGRHDSLTRALALAWSGVRESHAAVLRWALHAHSLYPIDPETMEELRAQLPETFSDDDWREGQEKLHIPGLTDWDEDGAERMLLSVKKPFFDLGGEAKAAGDAALGAWAAWGGALLERGDERKHPDYTPRHGRALQWLPQCFALAERCAEDGRYDDLERLLRWAGNFYMYDVARALPLLELLCREMPETHPLLGRFYECRGDLLTRTGKPEEALAAYGKAEAICRAKKDDLGLANVLKSRGDLLYWNGEDDKALAAWAEAEALYEKEKDDLGRANVLKSRGDLLYWNGEDDKALAAWAEAEALYKKEKDDLGRANVLHSRGDLLYYRKGEDDKALAAWAEAEALYEKEKDDLGRANVLRSRSDLLRDRADWAGARACYEAALHLYRQVQDSRGLCYTLSGLQLCLRRLGEETRAEDCAREAEALLPNQPEYVQRYVRRRLEAGKRG